MNSSRLTFRKFSITDFENMRGLESEIDIVKFTPMRIPQTPEQTRERLQKLVANENSGVWAVEKYGREFVGWVMLAKTELEHHELGFMMVKKYWQNGFATEIAKTICEYGFRDLKLPAISARTSVDNEKSIRVLEKVGFRFIKNASRPDNVLSGEIALKVFELLPGHSAQKNKS